MMLRGGFATILVIGVATALAVSGSLAAPVVFFGEDLSPGAVVPPGGDAVAARDRFLGRLAGGAATETFDGAEFSAGPAAILSLAFPAPGGTITGTLTGGAPLVCNYAVNCRPPASGEFPTSGLQWIATDAAMVLSFSRPIAAFGFFGTDIGDLGGRLTVTLEKTGPDVVLEVGTSLGASANGALVFWGFVDPVDAYTRILFGKAGDSRDFFGFDDMTVGDSDQVRVPEPGTLAAIAIGLCILGCRNRSRGGTVHRPPVRRAGKAGIAPALRACSAPADPPVLLE